MAPEPNMGSHGREEFDAALSRALEALGLDVRAAQRDRMWAHFELVVETNRQFNLTRITSAAEAAVKHYADSLSLLALNTIEGCASRTVLDVGTGAGFPAVPLAIMREDWQVTALDGTGKKARFVAEVGEKLGLANLSVHHARAGDWARQSGRRYGVLVLRAVGTIEAGLKEVRPLVGDGGEVVFYKTARMGEEELREGEAAAGRLGMKVRPSAEVTLPWGGGVLKRRLVRFWLGG